MITPNFVSLAKGQLVRIHPISTFKKEQIRDHGELWVSVTDQEVAEGIIHLKSLTTGHGCAFDPQGLEISDEDQD